MHRKIKAILCRQLEKWKNLKKKVSTSHIHPEIRIVQCLCSVSLKYISLLGLIHAENKIGKDCSHLCIRPVPPPPVSGHTFPPSEIISIIFHLSISLLIHFDFISSICFSHLGSFPAFTHLKNIKTCTLMHKHCTYLWFDAVHEKSLGLPFYAHWHGDLENSSVGLSFLTNFPFKYNIPIKGAKKEYLNEF